MFDVVVERARRGFAAQAINEHMVLATGSVTYLYRQSKFVGYVE